ncbi:MAG: S46 family peptidase [Ignavibacteriaceae bacterium]|nr:S46 family peptidase [Ignavibacteriaceae bacterium]
MKNLTVLTKLYTHLLITILTLCISNLFAQSSNEWFNPDTVKAGRFDTGKMWTFEDPPTEYFEEAYNFTPTQEWYENVRLATLKFATYCSASFVSADGLIMTNHHCARESVTEITGINEDLHKDGFIAEDLEDEKPVPGLFVDQCIKIEDVTGEVNDALEDAKTEEEITKIEEEKIKEIEKQYTDEKRGIIAKVTPLYFGGKYSLYIYKRYSDVRLVFAPEEQAGYFGGDYDNFTYPRYNLDCSFFRVYDDEGKPLKVDNYFKWSEEGVVTGEVVFIPGNPGSTSRLNTVAQLEYARDVTYPETIELLNSYIEFLQEMIDKDPEKSYGLNDQLLLYYNSIKAYKGMLKGLQDPVLMQKKKDFEKTFKNKVNSDSGLNEKYGDVWDKIEKLMIDLSRLDKEREVISYTSEGNPDYFTVAQELAYIAEELKLPESERLENYIGDKLIELIDSLKPEEFDTEENKQLLEHKIELLYSTLGKDNKLVKIFTNGKTGKEAVGYILSKTFLTSSEKIKEMVAEGPDSILNSGDPFLDYINIADEMEQKIDLDINKVLDQENALNRMLGRALFEVYGTSIPPDATFTLRISDGVVKGFPYNGTIAPPITTFYGMYDRYYSFDKKFPWSLSERWLNHSDEFNLSTPFNFVSTNDVVGGNSGSPIINENAEIVGVAFDGNIQSLPGDFIYDPEVNRCVGVESSGMLEAIKYIYKFERLAEELESGKCSY